MYKPVVHKQSFCLALQARHKDLRLARPLGVPAAAVVSTSERTNLTGGIE